MADSSGGLVLASEFAVELDIIELIAANPGSIALDTTATITVVGQNTTFQDTPPDFSIDGVSGVSITGGSLAVIDQTHATIEVISGTTSGTATITDATTDATALLTVAPKPPLLVWARRRRLR